MVYCKKSKNNTEIGVKILSKKEKCIEDGKKKWIRVKRYMGLH